MGAIGRLYLADASVFPTNLGGHPQLSIMTMAQCCAEAITGPAAPVKGLGGIGSAQRGARIRARAS
jgi:choline dehydrogenase-like flavoprotein